MATHSDLLVFCGIEARAAFVAAALRGTNVSRLKILLGLDCESGRAHGSTWLVKNYISDFGLYATAA
jgi:hypothetical protein